MYRFEQLMSWIDTHFSAAIVSGDGYTHADMVAERALRAALRDLPDDPRVAATLGLRLENRGAIEKALAIYEQRIEIDPSDAQAFVAQLAALLRLGKFSQATAAYRNASLDHKGLVVEHDTAERLLIAMIDGGGFDAEQIDLEQVFFLKPFVSRVSSIVACSRHFLDRYHFTYVALAKAYVEAKGGQLIYVSADNLFDVSNKSDAEQELLELAFWARMRERQPWLKSMPPHLADVYSNVPEFSESYLNEVVTGPGHILHGTRIVLPHYSSEYVNAEGNRRRTTGSPPSARNRILVLGGSDVYGFGSDDGRTICSYLQRIFNDKAPGEIRVENHGLRGNPLPICLNNLFQTHIAPGDKLVLFGYPKLVDAPQSLDSLVCHHVSFSRPHDAGEVFLDHSHVGPKGNEIIAQHISEVLSDLPEVDARVSNETATHASLEFIKYLIYRNSADVAEAGGLKEYLIDIRKISAGRTGFIGSVAVNCNPITLGHLHLLEYAARRVKHLFVFVIEEDLSFFPFADRLMLVEQALSYLPNVTVLRGGRYICTQLTYPEYYSKEEDTDAVADASMEAWFFCEFIAKEMGIQKIFLGNEPTCPITKQYNAKMAQLLPSYGVDIEIIPRISSPDGEIISASNVRFLLKNQDFRGIAKLVPPTTLTYLVERFSTEKVS